MDVIETSEVITIFIIIFLIVLIPLVLFLITQQNTLKLIQTQNRRISPGQVWLQLIPFFGLVWQFVVVSRIADSINNEMATGGSTFSFENQPSYYRPEEKPTYGIGIAYCVLACVSIIPLIGGLAGLAALICWIIYWVKLHGCKNQLQAMYNERG